MLLTPTLAVRFSERRFTQPEWLDAASESDGRRICVYLTEGQAKAELEKNLREWVENPISLIFFQHIKGFSINRRELSLQRLGAGPIANSQRLRLRAGTTQEVL